MASLSVLLSIILAGLWCPVLHGLWGDVRSVDSGEKRGQERFRACPLALLLTQCHRYTQPALLARGTYRIFTGLPSEKQAQRRPLPITRR